MISRDAYKYFEISCQHYLEIDVLLKNGEEVRGFANEIRLIDIMGENREFLVLRQPGMSIDIDLDDVYAMNAATENAHFSYVKIAGKNAAIPYNEKNCAREVKR
ncbi:Rho-binding antiterminator [Veronia pacifica]|uniref:Transcriptional antiterminator n=1 Tax=Veronia pacifica TaxID=1080227 RepID=A0A1C3EG69_9GAMM|nr:Rho-binding antiterminator [Veronia pacifica]ODA32228.1 hypothetical protein A8L45_13615 [Veronia pacifica]